MRDYREENKTFAKQLRVFKIIRNIAIPVFIVSFVVALILLSMDIVNNGGETYSYSSIYYLTGSLLSVIAQFGFDAMLVGIILSKIWARRIANREARIREGIFNDEEWYRRGYQNSNDEARHDDYSDGYYEEPKKEEPEHVEGEVVDKPNDRTKDFVNPDDPFH